MTSTFFKDTAVMVWRTSQHVFRSPDTIMTTTVMPVAMLLLFVYVFGGAIQTGTEKYVQYILPGILLVTIANGVGYVSYRLFMDVQKGLFDRFHTMPIARSSALWGHVVTALVAAAISVAVVFLVGLLMGYRTSAGLGAWLGVVGILGVFTLTMTWLSAIGGLTSRTMDGAVSIAYPLHLLPFISSAFVPTESMPGFVRAFAEHQPVTGIVNAIRALFDGQAVQMPELWTSLAWCGVIVIAAYLFTMQAYRKKILNR